MAPRPPMLQFCDPGGYWTTKVSATLFQATPQPMVHPCPEPKMPRFIKSMAPSILPRVINLVKDISGPQLADDGV